MAQAVKATRKLYGRAELSSAGRGEPSCGRAEHPKESRETADATDDNDSSPKLHRYLKGVVQARARPAVESQKKQQPKQHQVAQERKQQAGAPHTRQPSFGRRPAWRVE